VLDLEQYQIVGSTAREIAASAETAIREGALSPGETLPTVRALATALGTSPATVNSAYRILGDRGLVIGEGRRGTRVAPRPPVRSPTREPDRALDAQGLRDLSIGLPDPRLLPPLAPAVAALDVERYAQLDGLAFGVPELLDFARGWFRADGANGDAIAVVSGAPDGIERVLAAHLRTGDRVLVEDPAYPPIRDIVRALGLSEVPVAVDERGLQPDSLRDALRRDAQALLLVPRAQNPTGAALDPARAAELHTVLEPHPQIVVIEDDHTSEVAGVPYVSAVGPTTRHWAVIRSVSKILHPDLRVAVVAGDEETVARVEGRQALGPRWVSHLLQATTASMLSDPEFAVTCARARGIYAARRNALIDGLAGYGLGALGASGLNVWVPVAEEAPVLRELRTAGWLALSGERFRIACPPGIRITVTTLIDGEAEALALAIARAEHAGRPRTSY
jgi:DNA-binding transcriptional MocR family regulator